MLVGCVVRTRVRMGVALWGSHNAGSWVVTSSHSTVLNRAGKRLHLSPTKRDLILSDGVVNHLAQPKWPDQLGFVLEQLRVS